MMRNLEQYRSKRVKSITHNGLRDFIGRHGSGLIDPPTGVLSERLAGIGGIAVQLLTHNGL